MCFGRLSEMGLSGLPYWGGGGGGGVWCLASHFFVLVLVSE